MPEAILELVGKESALFGGPPQLLGNLCSIGIRCTHVPVLCHLLAPSRSPRAALAPGYMLTRA
jgi:hypothetical protein